jgi:tRNA threonylcarbamoyladenosine biosynthesis protein TsaE
MEIVFSIQEIQEVAQKVLSVLPTKVIVFKGSMGVGKTTLIKALSKQLGVNTPTSSPTFSLVNEYKTESGALIYHFDLYRLKNETEAVDIGIEEYLYSGNWCFIEWAEKITELLPEKYSQINISIIEDNERHLYLH